MAGNGLKLMQDVAKRVAASKGFDRIMEKVG
jgi:hypothetical protein